MDSLDKKIYNDSTAFGYDSKLKEKTNESSKALYNYGLLKAGSGDISGAIDLLEKSLEFNKRNIQARNLAGLCYYATGKIGDALCHWIVSQAYQKDDNPANDYINDMQENSRLFDRMSASIVLYNQALEFLKAGNEDMAIIRLKKCVEQNPSFVEALNLLSLGYLSIGKKANAEECVRKALTIDPQNPRSLSYLVEITGIVQKNSIIKKKSGSLEEQEIREIKRKKDKNFINDSRLSEIICVLIGAVIVWAVFSFLIIPESKKEEEDWSSILNEAAVSAQLKLEEALDEKEDVIAGLYENIGEKDDRIAELLWYNLVLERMQLVYAAQSNYYQNKLEEAYTVATGIDTTGFSAEVAGLRNQIIYDSGTKLESDLFKTAKSDYDKNRYDNAKAGFEKALIYSQYDSQNKDDILYYLGRIAERDQENLMAIAYYERLLNDHPDSNQIKNAEERLKKLQP